MIKIIRLTTILLVVATTSLAAFNRDEVTSKEEKNIDSYSNIDTTSKKGRNSIKLKY